MHPVTAVVVPRAIAAQAAQPAAAGHKAGRRPRLAVGVAGGAGRPADIGRVRAIAGRIGIATGDLCAQRPDADRCASADKTAITADDIADQVFLAHRVHRHIARGFDRHPGIHLGEGVVAQRAHIDRAGDAGIAADGNADHIAADGSIVGRFNIHALVRVGAAGGDGVDQRTGVDHRFGAGGDQTHADGTRHRTGAASGAGDHDMGDILAGLRLHNHAMCRLRIEITARCGAGQNAGNAIAGHAAAAQCIHLGGDPNRGLGGFVEHDHADRRADAQLSAHTYRAGNIQHMRGVGRDHAHITHRGNHRAIADGSLGGVANRQHVDHRAAAHRATDRHTHANLDDGFRRCRYDRDFVLRGNFGAVANGGLGGVGDGVHANRRRRGRTAANCQADIERHVVEIIARANQHGLPGAGIAGIAGLIDLRPGADIRLGIRAEHVDPDRNGHPEFSTRAEGNGEAANFILRAGGNRHAVEAGVGAFAGGAIAGQRGIVDVLALAVPGQVHATQRRRIDLAGAVQRSMAAAGGDAFRVDPGALCRFRIEFRCRRIHARQNLPGGNRQPGGFAIRNHRRIGTDKRQGRFGGNGHARASRNASLTAGREHTNNFVQRGIIDRRQHHAAIGVHGVRPGMGRGVRVVANKGASLQGENMNARIHANGHLAADGDTGGDGNQVFGRFSCNEQIPRRHGHAITRADISVRVLAERANINAHTNPGIATGRKRPGDGGERGIVTRGDRQAAAADRYGGAMGNIGRCRIGDHVHRRRPRHPHVAANGNAGDDIEDIFRRGCCDVHTVAASGNRVARTDSAQGCRRIDQNFRAGREAGFRRSANCAGEQGGGEAGACGNRYITG